MTKLSKRVSKVNIQTRLRVDEETWPPSPPKTFTPLVLIQYQGHLNLKQSTAMTKFVEQGYIDKLVPSSNIIPEHHHKIDNHEPLQEVFNTSKVTKEVAEILSTLEKSDDPQFILIEGAPGIGKSVLLKEIEYLWATKQILQKFKLVLLTCLRDPAVQQEMPLINDLLKLFCKRDQEAAEIVSACSKYLLNNDGEDLVLMFDGYDEYPESLRKNGLIADILKRNVVPCCGLIISSRPDASVSLREQATVRVDILGFSEAEREHYITESMKGQPQKVKELTQYLQGHSTISSLCFVPFNIVVLVYLYKQGIPLPQNSAQLYNYFICLTICRHLFKCGHHLESNITELADMPKLTDLPEPYNKIIKQLSKLSLEALNNNKLIFTLDEIKAACPDITAIPGAIKGFGLLQAVEHFGLTGTITTFNFLHFSIQEYLAAHHIANLPANEELRIIEDNFWSKTHFNMFSIYVTFTKGQRPAFKDFLCSGNKAITISDKFLNDQLRCLHLYHCYHEAGDDDICKTIEQSVTFSKKRIALGVSGTLAVSDVESLTVFLASSFQKEWQGLNLSDCYIQDHGLHLLHRGLLRCHNITITALWLHYNGLTMLSSSLIRNITVSCNVKELWINDNYTIGEDERLYSILTDPSTMLETLYMYNTHLSSRAATALFDTLKYNNKLKQLNIARNEITDDACDAITTALKENSCLVRLYMYENPLTGKAIVNIVNSLKDNNTLELLGLPKCPENGKTRISFLQKVINTKRESLGFQAKLSIL